MELGKGLHKSFVGIAIAKDKLILANLLKPISKINPTDNFPNLNLDYYSTQSTIRLAH